MKLSDLYYVWEWDERRAMLIELRQQIADPGCVLTICVECSDEEVARDDDGCGGAAVIAAYDAYLAGIITALEADIRKAGVEIDEPSS